MFNDLSGIGDGHSFLCKLLFGSVDVLLFLHWLNHGLACLALIGPLFITVCLEPLYFLSP